jgi:N-acetylmuramoyl-L-alanine amidase
VTSTEAISPPAPLGDVNVVVPLGDLVNVRSGPGVRYSIVGQLAQEQSAPVTGKSEDEQWWQIVFQGQPGWVAIDFVQVTGDPTAVPAVAVPVLTEAIVPRGDIVNVRSGPGTEYPVNARLRQFQSALIVGKSADGLWWQVRVGALAGWLSARYVRTVGDTSSVPVTQP